MNPIMRNMQSKHAKTAAAQQSKRTQNTRKPQAPQRPAPPSRQRLMSTPLSLQTGPCHQARSVPCLAPAPLTNVNYDEKLTHLSSLFPGIDNSIIMDILIQKRGNIEAATGDLFQLTSPGDPFQTGEPMPPLEIDPVELPPCYEELDLAYNFEKNDFEEFSSLPPSLNHSKESKKLKKRDLKKYNTSLALPVPQFKPPNEYLKKWKKGETCWLNVNGRQVLIGPLPNDFLRIKKPMYGRSQSMANPTTTKSPLYHPPPPLTPSPSQEINEARDGRISPFRLPLKLEELDVVDPEETENQVLEDWKLAKYLQNMEFVTQVRENRDLYASIRVAADTVSPTGTATQASLYSQDTIKRLDKNTKKKLTKLARKISKEDSGVVTNRNYY